MTIFATALAIAAFLAAFRGFAIIAAARRALSLAGGATGVMRDNTLSDDEKEAAVQRDALSMLRASGSIFWRVAATLICAIAPIYVLDLIGFVDAGQVFAFLARPDVIIGASVLVGVGFGGCRDDQNAAAPIPHWTAPCIRSRLPRRWCR